MKYNEVLLNACWIEGDEEIREDDGLFLAVSAKLAELIEIKDVKDKGALKATRFNEGDTIQRGTPSFVPPSNRSRCAGRL